MCAARGARLDSLPEEVFYAFKNERSVVYGVNLGSEELLRHLKYTSEAAGHIWSYGGGIGGSIRGGIPSAQGPRIVSEVLEAIILELTLERS